MSESDESREEGDYTKAEPLYRRALAIREKSLGPEHHSVAVSLHNLAAHYHSKEDYARAERLYRRVLAINSGRNTQASLFLFATWLSSTATTEITRRRNLCITGRWRSARRRLGRNTPMSLVLSTTSPCSMRQKATYLRP